MRHYFFKHHSDYKFIQVNLSLVHYVFLNANLHHYVFKLIRSNLSLVMSALCGKLVQLVVQKLMYRFFVTKTKIHHLLFIKLEYFYDALPDKNISNPMFSVILILTSILHRTIGSIFQTITYCLIEKRSHIRDRLWHPLYNCKMLYNFA